MHGTAVGGALRHLIGLRWVPHLWKQKSRPLRTGSDLHFFRRAGEIRTPDLLTPSQAR